MDIRPVIRLPDHVVDPSNGSEDRRRREKKEPPTQKENIPQKTEPENTASTPLSTESDRQILDTKSWLELRSEVPEQQSKDANNVVRQYGVFQKK